MSPKKKRDKGAGQSRVNVNSNFGRLEKVCRRLIWSCFYQHTSHGLIFDGDIMWSFWGSSLSQHHPWSISKNINEERKTTTLDIWKDYNVVKFTSTYYYIMAHFLWWAIGLRGKKEHQNAAGHQQTDWNGQMWNSNVMKLTSKSTETESINWSTSKRNLLKTVLYVSKTRVWILELCRSVVNR